MMKRRLTTPSHDMAAELRAAPEKPTNPYLNPLTTPSNDTAAGPKVEMEKPTNPYLKLQCLMTPMREDLHPIELVVKIGVADDAHTAPPPRLPHRLRRPPQIW